MHHRLHLLVPLRSTAGSGTGSSATIRLEDVSSLYLQRSALNYADTRCMSGIGCSGHERDERSAKQAFESGHCASQNLPIK